MTWDFTPTQVMKGEVDYELDDFRRDLFVQVKHNFGDTLSKDKLEDCCNLFWLFCHFKAIMLTEEEIGEKLSMDKGFVGMMSEICSDDGKMLAAIYQNLYIKYFELGLRESWGDENRATNRALALVNRYISRHLNV
jgi:hypothetical protein